MGGLKALTLGLVAKHCPSVAHIEMRQRDCSTLSPSKHNLLSKLAPCLEVIKTRKKGNSWRESGLLFFFKIVDANSSVKCVFSKKTLKIWS